MVGSQRGDLAQVPFEEALWSAYPVIFSRLVGRFHDPQLAEEVAWDSLTRAYEVWREDPHHFEQRNLTEWSSQLAGWRALDLLRKRSRYPSLVGDPFEEGLSVPAGKQSQQGGRLAQSREQDLQMVWDGLEQLDASERDLLVAAYFDGRSDQSIGAEEYPDGSDTARGLRVWRRRQKAQAHLRDHLLAAGFEPDGVESLSGQAL